MLIIIIPGLHYAGLIQIFPNSSPGENNREWTPIASPNLHFQTINGKDFSLQKIKTKAILINFWASWCKPCYEEFPELIQAVKWGKGNITLVAVSVDSSKKDIEHFLNLIHFKHNLNIYIVWDPKYKMARQFHVIRFPETFVLNQNLKIVVKQAGQFSFKKVKPVLNSLLNLTHSKK